MKKLTRGIDREFAMKFKESTLFTLYEIHKDELFLGVRNDYLNLYYNCDSVAKVMYKKREGVFICEIDKYYLDGQPHTRKDKRARIAPSVIFRKYGSQAIGGKCGINKHIDNFNKYQENGYFNAKEIADIIENQKMLGVNVPKELQNVTAGDITEYAFYVITLDNNGETPEHSTPKQTMAAYLFNDKRWGCKELSPGSKVEEKFGDVTKKNNRLKVSFLFSEQTLNNLKIDDIIDGNYDERILPE